MSAWRLPRWLTDRLLAVAHGRMARGADLTIGGNPDDPYMRRWHLWRIPWLSSCYVRLIRHSDDDRALHDHPWPNVSVLLAGSYVEVMPVDPARPAGAVMRVPRGEGSVVARRAGAAHRLEVVPGAPVVSLFLTGPRIRRWGFWCPKGWVHWKLFVDPDDRGRIGRGCGEDAA